MHEYSLYKLPPEIRRGTTRIRVLEVRMARISHFGMRAKPAPRSRILRLFDNDLAH